MNSLSRLHLILGMQFSINWLKSLKVTRACLLEKNGLSERGRGRLVVKYVSKIWKQNGWQVLKLGFRCSIIGGPRVTFLFSAIKASRGFRFLSLWACKTFIGFIAIKIITYCGLDHSLDFPLMFVMVYMLFEFPFLRRILMDVRVTARKTTVATESPISREKSSSTISWAETKRYFK